MLKKNVYILYPPGYSGSYVNWAISISDQDSRKVTVDNPINKSSSKQFGGQGTSHHHVRIPTHQSYEHHVNWVILNRPTDSKIYILNSNNQNVIVSILQHDPDGIFINIHDNNDSLVGAYGLINCVTKWPTFVELNVPTTDTFNPFDCANSLQFRNEIADYVWPAFDSNKPVDYEKLDSEIKRKQRWFNIRNSHQPHEINDSTYLTNVSYKNRIFEMSCLDVASEKFLERIKDIMERGQPSDQFDLDFINNFHQNYIDAQPNLQWFESVQHWKNTGELDSYLTSHSIIEACLIREIFNSLNLYQFKIDDKKWNRLYTGAKDPAWPDCENEEDFYKLSPAIQTELIEQHNYVPKTKIDDLLIDLKNHWKTWDIYKINNVYQEIQKTRINTISN